MCDLKLDLRRLEHIPSRTASKTATRCRYSCKFQKTFCKTPESQNSDAKEISQGMYFHKIVLDG